MLSFYKAQTRLISNMLPGGTSVHVMSVDSAQGNEFDTVILSCVVDGRRHCFLRDARRMNVALSRAKRNLVVVGSHSLPHNLPSIAAVAAASDVAVA